jgi:hypothetical protein
MRPWALLLLSGCAYSLQDDLAETRLRIRELERSIPPESPLWIAEGPDRFDAFIQDDTAEVPEHVHHHVLWTLSRSDPAEAERASAGRFDFEACRRDPAAFRGRFWRVEGLVGDLRPEPVPHPRRPLPGAHAGALFDDAGRILLFHLAEKPEVLTLRVDHAALTGLFVQWVSYTSRSGRPVSAPFFIGPVMRRIL